MGRKLREILVEEQNINLDRGWWSVGMRTGGFIIQTKCRNVCLRVVKKIDPRYCKTWNQISIHLDPIMGWGSLGTFNLLYCLSFGENFKDWYSHNLPVTKEEVKFFLLHQVNTFILCKKFWFWDGGVVKSITERLKVERLLSKNVYNRSVIL